MLTTESIQKASVIANNVDAAGFYVTAVEGSPLDHIVSKVMELPALEDYDSNEGVQELVELNTETDLLNNRSAYDSAMIDVTEKYIPLFQSVLEKAHSQILPVYKAYVTTAQEKVSKLDIYDLLNVNIVNHSLPALPDDPGFAGMVEDHSYNTRFKPEGIKKPRVAQLTREDEDYINETINTADRFTNDAIGNWLIEGAKRTGTDVIDFVINLWNEVFNAPLDELNNLFNQPIVGLDRALFAFIFANRLCTNVDKLDGVTSAEAKSFAGYIRGLAGFYINNHCKKYKDNVRLGVMVENVNPAKKEIVVNNVVFEEWSKNPENTIEIILGNLNGRINHRSVRAIEEHRDALEREWNVQRRSAEADNSAAKKKALRQVLIDGIVQTVQAVGVDVGSLDTISKKVEDFVLNTNDKKLFNVQEVCLEIVSQICFPGSDSNRILVAINREHEKDPSLSVNECATLAVVDLVTEWTMSQIVVNKK